MPHSRTNFFPYGASHDLDFPEIRNVPDKLASPTLIAQRCLPLLRGKSQHGSGAYGSPVAVPERR